MAEILEAAAHKAFEAMAGNDLSHDYEHVQRVVNKALAIAAAEGVKKKEDLLDIQLAAWLHDIGDHKYSDQEDAALVWLQEQNYPRADLVYDIIQNVSWSKNEKDGRKEPPSLLHAIVQDADRLDAMGAIGIARVFAYAGRKGDCLRDAVDHVHEKILRLLPLIKTEAGTEMALSRQATLESFVTAIYREAQFN